MGLYNSKAGGSTSSSSVAVSVAGVGDHDLPLFAISCIHKHLRSASSQPGYYTVLYFLFFDDLCFFLMFVLSLTMIHIRIVVLSQSM